MKKLERRCHDAFRARERRAAARGEEPAPESAYQRPTIAEPPASAGPKPRTIPPSGLDFVWPQLFGLPLAE